MKTLLFLITLTFYFNFNAQDFPIIKSPHYFDILLCEKDGKAYYWSKAYDLGTNKFILIESKSEFLSQTGVVELEEKQKVANVFWYKDKLILISSMNIENGVKYYYSEYDLSLTQLSNTELFSTSENCKIKNEEVKILIDGNLLGIVSNSKSSNTDDCYAFVYNLDTKEFKLNEFTLEKSKHAKCMDFIMNQHLEMNIIFGDPIDLRLYGYKKIKFENTLVSCGESVKKQVFPSYQDSLLFQSYKFLKINEVDFVLGSMVFDVDRTGFGDGYSICKMKFGYEHLYKPSIIKNDKILNSSLKVQKKNISKEKYVKYLFRGNFLLVKIIQTSNDHFIFVSEDLYISESSLSHSSGITNISGVPNLTYMSNYRPSSYQTSGDILISKINSDLNQVEWCDITVGRTEYFKNFKYVESFEPSFFISELENSILIQTYFTKKSIEKKENNLPNDVKAFDKTPCLMFIDKKTGSSRIELIFPDKIKETKHVLFFENTKSNGYIWANIYDNSISFKKSKIQYFKIDY